MNENKVSSIVSRQLPEFIRADHPRFVTLLEKYYEYMEQQDKALYSTRKIPDYMDVDHTRADLLKYFKTKVIPSFPDTTELSKEKIIKAARSFYAKKGTPEGFKFLFRILYAQEIDVYFPKEDILKASDGKWQQPQALRISVANTATAISGGNVNVFISRANTVNANGINLVEAGITSNSYIRIANEQRKVLTVNSAGDYVTVDVPFPGIGQIFDSATLYKISLNDYSNFDFTLLERRKGVGSLSKTTCIVESAIRTVDKDTGRDIAEIYVSNVKRPFTTNENIEISYIDPTTNTAQTFSSKIISLVSNVSLYRNRFGKIQSGSGYKTGDPVVFYGGLSNTDEAQKAVATVNNVSTGQIDFVTLEAPGYYFRDWQNSLIRIANTTNGISGNLIIDAIWEDGGTTPGNSASWTFNIDAIESKLNTTLDAADYQFANIPTPGVTDASTTLGDAFSYETYTLGKIRYLTLVNRGSFFETTPTFDPISLHDTDFSSTTGYLSVPGSAIQNYSPTNKTIQLVGSSYSDVANYYAGARFFIQTTSTSAHYAKVLSSTVTGSGASKTNTLTLDSSFESNITALNAGNFTYYFDFRADVRGTGRLSKVDVLSGGTGYSGTDVVHFIGTGYDASATITVSSGAITAVALTANGEGYYSRPTCVIRNSSGGASGGSGAVLVAYTLSDGETITAATTGIGEIQSFNLISRGYDYANTPNVSLKVVDILSDNLLSSAILVSGDAVWQGGATNLNATFSGWVDEVYRESPTSSVIRVYNYNGDLDHTLPLKINTATGNVTTNVHYFTANISFNGVNPATSRLYPFFYGNGLAKANAEFASGLIKYDGYYLNTDGHVSADKKLQNKDYYHNFSYEIQSEKSLSDYKKTVYDVAHPAGMQLLSKYVMKDVLDAKTSNTSQTSTLIVPTGFEGDPTINASPVRLVNTPEYEILLHMDGDAGSSTFVDATGNYGVESYYFGANTITQSSTVQKSGYGNTTKFPHVYLISFGSYAGGYLKVVTDSTGLSLNSGTDWTIEGWFYTTDSQNRDQCIFYFGNDNGTANYIRMGISGTTSKTVAMTGLWAGSSTTTNFALNTWYHFALVRDSATLRFRLYVNGKFEKESAVITGGIPTTANLRIGADSSAGVSSITQNDCFTGYMDEISLRMASNYYTANTTAGVSTYTVPTSPLVHQYYAYNLSSNVAVIGDNNSDFTEASEGDLIIIDSSSSRNFVKEISYISSSHLLYTETSIAFIGDGRLTTTSACNQVTVSGNAAALSSTIQADDFIEFKILPKTFYANSVNITNAIVNANTSNLSASDAGFDELTVGEVVNVNSQLRVVSAITNANSFIVSESFTYSGTDKQIEQGSSLIRKVSSISGNVITLDTVSPSSNSNVVYKVYPYHTWVSYKIIKPL